MKANRRRAVLMALPAILVLALSGGLVACGDDEDASEALRGSGNVVTEEMELADFTAVEAANAFAVDIAQSDSFNVSIRVDDNVLDLVDVSKVGDTLTLRLRQGVTISGDVTLEATITMPELERLELSGAASTSISGFRSSGPLDIALSGASALVGDLEAGSVDLNASGASRVVLQGSAAELTIVGSGASNLDLADFLVDTAEVELSGASEGTVNVRERIDSVDVSGASRLRYLGDPSLGDVSTSGTSTVDKLGD